MRLFIPTISLISGIRLYESPIKLMLCSILFLTFSSFLCTIKKFSPSFAENLRTYIKRALTCSLFFIIGIILFHIRCKPKLSQSAYCVFKNVTMTVQATSIIPKSSSPYSFSGYGIITDAPTNLKQSIGNRAFFSVKASACESIPLIGQKFTIKCNCSATKPDSKSWFFKYLHSSRISWSLSKCHLIELHDDFSKMPKIYDYLRNKFIKTLAIGSDNYTDEAGILKGMLTGFKDSIPNKNSSILHDLGLGHLFAVSGIHIGIIAVTLNFVLSMVLIPKKFRGIIVIITIFFYVHAIGAPPSAKRAMTMFAFYLFCSSVGRSPNVLSALTNSALLYVLIDPFVVFNISFLLSYSVVCGIILIGTPLENFLKRKILNTYGLKISAFEKKDIILFHVKKHAISAFAIASSAYLSGMLFSIETFNTLTLLTIPVGILAIPIASCAIILGTISLIFGLVNIDFMCLILNKIAFNIIKFMNIILQLAHSDWCCIKDVHLPFFSGATLTSVLLVTSYTLLSYLHSNRHKKQVPDKLLAI